MSKHGSDESHWVSLSDMMTSLMMVFLFIAILFMYQMQKQLTDFQDSKQAIYHELQTQFEPKFTEWDMELDKDLTIKFNNPDVLFDQYSSDITPLFSDILAEFVPKYLAIISKEEYKETIAEVRIEGHTALDDNYMYTISLSQDRANAVLGYILSSGYYQSLPQKTQEELRFWITANGLGSGRMLDNNGDYVFQTEKSVDKRSRRVEFKIVTRSEELIEEVINTNISEN